MQIGASPSLRPAQVVEAKPVPAPRVAVLIVTWNRKDAAADAIDAVARQDFPRHRLDVVVIDNASTDATLDTLAQRYRPDSIVENPTRQAHHPDFRPRPVGERLGNKPGFASLTLIRNADNLGGCGGFNTGLAYVEHALAGDRGTRLLSPDGSEDAARSSRPEFVWLVDDDAEPAPDALARLVEAMRSDPAIGLVGSRTVDIRDRRTTIESTIYQEHATGVFADQPDPGHPRKPDHDAWVATVGGTKGRRTFTGLRDVDIVSACSMLARWSAVERVGFWDHRYFIYCDDADWCLRFARAGYRVVLSLDAVVFHTPWHHKLTPARLYYAQRNLLWTIHKTFDPARLRGVMRLRTRTLLRQAREAALCHRLHHAEIIRRSVEDAIRNQGGTLDLEAPKPVPMTQVARSITNIASSSSSSSSSSGVAGILPANRPKARTIDPPSACRGTSKPLTIAFVLHRPIALDWAAGVRTRLVEALGPDRPVRWVEFVRNDVQGAHEVPVPPGVTRSVYAPHLKSRLRRQGAAIKNRVDLLVIFDGACDLPLVRAPRWVFHVDSGKPTEGVLERGGLGQRVAFLGRLLGTWRRARTWTSRLRPADPTGKFGGLPPSVAGSVTGPTRG